MKTPVQRFYDMLFHHCKPTRKQEAALKRFLREERKVIDKAIHFGYMEEGDFMGIEYFYEKEFNKGKNICPHCKQGIQKLQRPGKYGCTVCEA
jgi:hypothetical protein